MLAGLTETERSNALRILRSMIHSLRDGNDGCTARSPAPVSSRSDSSAAERENPVRATSKTDDSTAPSSAMSRQLFSRHSLAVSALRSAALLW